MQIYSTTKMPPPLFTKINAIPQICTSGGDVYYASRNLLIHFSFLFSNPQKSKLLFNETFEYTCRPTLFWELVNSNQESFLIIEWTSMKSFLVINLYKFLYEEIYSDHPYSGIYTLLKGQYLAFMTSNENFRPINFHLGILYTSLVWA